MAATAAQIPTRTTSSSRSVLTAAPVWRVGALAAVSAAVATTAFAAGAKALGVSLEAGGDAIPLIGFAYITLWWAAVGTVLAVVLARRAKRPARTFVITTLVLTALSFAPPLTTADLDAATRITLCLSHVVAAAIVISMLAARLSHVRHAPR